MKIVFHLSELAADIEDGAGRLFEANGGTLGDGLTLTSMNKDTQELLFTINDEGAARAKVFDLSPTVTDESADVGDGPSA